jgi:hypothetical protein
MTVLMLTDGVVFALFQYRNDVALTKGQGIGLRTIVFFDQELFN